MEALIGQQLGKYTIERMLGRGGMAAVFLANDPSMERQVAIKILPREFAYDPMYVERFRREVMTIAKLTHPNIVPVHDYGEDQGWTYIVMTYMPGGTLHGRIRKMGNTMPLDLILTYFEQIASALDYAHAQRVIHRDFKPGNVLVGDKKHVLLSDFGVAKVSEATSALTGTGVVGTPAYMAPELANRGGLSPLVDVYAAGVTLYELVTGSAPFEADTPMGLLMAHMSTPVPDARYLRPDVTDEIQGVIEKAMAKDPEQRYQSTGELVEDLRTVIDQSVTSDSASISAADAEEDGLYTIQTPPPARQTAPNPVAASPMTMPAASSPMPTRKSGVNMGLLVGGVLALAAVIVLVLGFLGVLPLGLSGPKVAEMTATSAPADQPTSTTQATEVAVISLQPTAKVLFGDVELKAAGASDFAVLTADSPLSTGASVRTGPDGAALLVLAEGVSAELHPSSLLTIQRLEAIGDTLFVELAQEAGTAYHFIGSSADGLKRDYVVISPRGITRAVGTQFWISETAEGWYYIPSEGVITHDLHDLVNDPSDQYEEYASKNDCLLVDANFNIFNCALPGGLTLLTDGKGLVATLTPTFAVVVGGQQPTPTAELPTSTATAVAEACSPGWLPTGGCVCCGQTLTCADGTVALINPACLPGGHIPPTSAPGCGSCGDIKDHEIAVGCGTSNCPSSCEYFQDWRDSCGAWCDRVTWCQ